MKAREAVFANIRRSLGVGSDEAPRRFEVEARLAQAPAGIVPERGQGDVKMRVITFRAEAERAQATVVEIPTLAEVPAEVARFLRNNNCPASLRMGDDPRLAGLPWSATPLEILHGASDGHDPNALSFAFAGIAETGTLALVSGRIIRPHLTSCPTATSSWWSGTTSLPIMRASLPGSGMPTAKAARPALSISSRGRRVRPTSSRPCCLARTDRGGSTSSSPAKVCGSGPPQESLCAFLGTVACQLGRGGLDEGIAAGRVRFR